MSDYFLIAKISSVAKEGFLRIDVIADPEIKLAESSEVYLDFWGNKKKFYVSEVREKQGKFFVKFYNFETDRETQLLLGREVYIDHSKLIELPEGSFFFDDLIDCEVWRDNESIGRVKSYFKTPANAVIEIRDGSNKETLIPFVKDLFISVDVNEKKIILKSGAGLYDED